MLFCFLIILYSTQDGKRKQKKVTHKSKNPSEIVSQKDSTVASWESKPGSTNLHVQGQGHSNDTDTCSSSVASFIQQKVNKKLMKATQRKREQGLLRGMLHVISTFQNYLDFVSKHFLRKNNFCQS